MSAFSSPRSSSSRTMSEPPTNFPWMNTWGMVGQRVYSLMPSRTSGSDEHVDPVHRPVGLEDLHRRGAEAAAGEERVALHVDDHGVRPGLAVEACLEVGGHDLEVLVAPNFFHCSGE